MQSPIRDAHAFGVAILALAQIAVAQEPGPVPEGLSAADWTGIQAAHEARRYAVCLVEDSYQARNPEQQWRTRFDGRGFVTSPDAGSWTWGLELERYGFAGTEQVVTSSARVSAEGGRVAYEWDATLEEWYVNDTRGLEHGYTVHRRPFAEEQGERDAGPLTFTLAVRGELRAEVAGAGRSVRFLDEGGAVALTYAGLLAFDADGQELEASFELLGDEGDRLLLRVDERGARYPLTIDPIAQQAYLKASNTGAFDQFGASVSVSGNTVVIGAPLERSSATGVNGDQSDNSAISGAAYVFARSGTAWVQQAYLKASNTDVGDQFGAAVSVSGDTVVVGAIRESSSATGVDGDQNDNSANFSGAAYVFVRSGSSWSQQAYLKASNAEALYYFGASVGVSGDTVVVGAWGEASTATGVNGDESNNGLIQAGAAYVFVRNGTSWSQEAYLKASNTDFQDYFGFSAGVSGDTVVVGAWQEGSSATGVDGGQADNSAPQSGAAYVFTRSGSAWSQEAYLKASNTQAVDFFGYSVAVSGDTVAVGAFWEDSSATGVNGDGSDNSALASGAAYVFARSGSTWSQQAYLKASNTGADDSFGRSVGVSGNRVVVGAFSEDSSATGVNGDQSDNSASSSGAAYVFARSGTTWSQEEYLKASNTDANENFGNSVAVSGNLVVVGANHDDSSATGVNGDGSDNGAASSGAAFLFGCSSAATFRNAGSNPASYSASAPVLGSTWTGTVDLTTTGHSCARIYAFLSPANVPIIGGQVVLIGGARAFRLPLQAGPQAMWSMPVPNDPSLACVTIYTQAIHVLGVTPIAVSNAQDLVAGY